MKEWGYLFPAISILIMNDLFSDIETNSVLVLYAFLLLCFIIVFGPLFYKDSRKEKKVISNSK